jgi:hypothetical protein
MYRNKIKKEERYCVDCAETRAFIENLETGEMECTECGCNKSLNKEPKQ